MQILIDIHLELLRCADQRLKGIPSPNSRLGACLQTHITLAYSLSGSQLSRIVVQENFGMDQHHQQGFFLGQSQREALVQLFVATGLLKEPLKLTSQRVGILGIGMVLIGHKLTVQFPEALLEALQYLAMVRDARYQLLVVAELMDPAER